MPAPSRTARPPTPLADLSTPRRPAPRRRAPSALAAALIAGAVALAGCQGTPFRNDDGSATNTTKGGALGALGGAAIGAIAGGRKGALIGLGVGALSGGAVGQYMDRQQRALDEELGDSGVTVSREGDNLRLNMPGSLTFASGSDAVQPRFDPVLRDIAAVLGQYDKTLVDVVGHTDSTGSASYNETLSKRRARSVAEALERGGVIDARVVTDGRGSSEPTATNATPTGRESNRRVEILLTPLTET